jgi:hypothetical protein
MTEEVKKSSPALVAIAWLIVVIPTAWGLSKTVQNAMKIFTTAPSAATSAPGYTPAAH